jgi:hypothetical protein
MKVTYKVAKFYFDIYAKESDVLHLFFNLDYHSSYENIKHKKSLKFP